jgi:hypothetical protein
MPSPTSLADQGPSPSPTSLDDQWPPPPPTKFVRGRLPVVYSLGFSIVGVAGDAERLLQLSCVHSTFQFPATESSVCDSVSTVIRLN